MVTPEQIQSWLEDKLDADSIRVDGDGHHFEAIIISKQFEGLNRLARHRLVYQALGDKMDSLIHALSIKTLTIEEAKK